MADRPKNLGEMWQTYSGFRYFVLAVGGAITGLGGLLYLDISALKVTVGKIDERLAIVQRDVKSVQDRIEVTAKNAADVMGTQTREITEALAKIENRLPPTPPFRILALENDEQIFLRDYFKLKIISRSPPKYKLGETVSWKYLPDEVIRKLPMLTGHGFANDPNGDLLIADSYGRIVAIILAL